MPFWPKSANAYSAPSPPLTNSDPSRAKARSPTECVLDCEHQSSISTRSRPSIRPPRAVSTDSRPLVTQPSLRSPGGSGQTSAPSRVGQRGAFPPIGAL
jgi:hypothetical protein